MSCRTTLELRNYIDFTRLTQAELPGLFPHQRCVILVYAQGMKRTVVQREANNLDIHEENKHPQLVQQAMLEELQ